MTAAFVSFKASLPHLLATPGQSLQNHNAPFARRNANCKACPLLMTKRKCQRMTRRQTLSPLTAVCVEGLCLRARRALRALRSVSKGDVGGQYLRDLRAPRDPRVVKFRLFQPKRMYDLHIFKLDSSELTC